MKKHQQNSARAALQIIVSINLLFLGAILFASGFTLGPEADVSLHRSALSSANIDLLEATMSLQEAPDAPPVSMIPLQENGNVDMPALGVHPLPAPLALHESSGVPGPDGSAMGTGKAFMSITNEVVNQSTNNAFGVLSTGWSPGESVQFYLNGTLSNTFVSSSQGGLGYLGISVNTGAGFGYITIEEKGLSSGKDTGGVVQVAPTGPYLPGTAAAPHAVNTAGITPFLLTYGVGYAASASVGAYRNGVLQGTTTTNASGIVFQGWNPANNGNTSSVWGYDRNPGVAGNMTGAPVEERSDAGT